MWPHQNLAAERPNFGCKNKISNLSIIIGSIIFRMLQGLIVATLLLGTSAMAKVGDPKPLVVEGVEYSSLLQISPTKRLRERTITYYCDHCLDVSEAKSGWAKSGCKEQMQLYSYRPGVCLNENILSCSGVKPLPSAHSVEQRNRFWLLCHTGIIAI